MIAGAMMVMVAVVMVVMMMYVDDLRGGCVANRRGYMRGCIITGSGLRRAQGLLRCPCATLMITHLCGSPQQALRTAVTNLQIRL